MAPLFTGLTVATATPSLLKRRYSVTQDILGYRRCPRQYGAFHVHKYAPAHQTQLYFGTILHQVLDRCHAHYHGLLDPRTKGTLPDGGGLLTDADIDAYFLSVGAAMAGKTSPPPPPTELLSYFVEVEDGLKSRGIRAITRDLRVKAVRILQYFNRLEGPSLYPRVRDTEHRLQADQGTHILHGVVDLLVDTPESPGDPATCEIWDYKGMSRYHLGYRELDNYLFQMRVYAHLYELKHKVLPKQVVLYFLGELDGPTCPSVRPVNATLDLDTSTGLGAVAISTAMAEFAKTVKYIENARATDIWAAAAIGEISEQDCAICDKRWDCKTPNKGKGVAMRYP